MKLNQIAMLLVAGMGVHAAELKWIEPYEVAKQEAKRTGKPMLVFIGNLESCKDCQAFTNELCTAPAFMEYAAANLVCARVLEVRSDSKEERWTKSRIIEEFNIPAAHAVIIANKEGKRIGELSTAPLSVVQFIADIQMIVAKAPINGEGRLKYSEVEMFDKTFVPAKTYASSVPAFSNEPLKGRYINFMTTVRVQPWENTRTRSHGTWMERSQHTPEIALKMRKSLAEAFPGARMTWGWSWHALVDPAPNYVELRKLMAEIHKQYGDEITLYPGVYFENKFNTIEQSKKDLHDGLELVSKMVGDGYRPKSVLAGIMSIEAMKFLAENEGIHVVQGQIWSQFNVDGQGGDGGIIYPYYPSRGHYLKPAQGSRQDADFLDMVNLDGWSVDFFAARNNGGGSRDGIGPLETNGGYGLGMEYGTKEMLHVTDVHFNDQAVAHNGFGYLPNIWELCVFSWIHPNYLSNWLKEIRTKYPDTQMLTLGEFGELWRKHNPDNSRINLKFVERGNGLMPSLEEAKKINPNYHHRADLFCPEMEIRWYFNKDFRLATMRNWKENGPLRIMDYTRYNQPYLEPAGNVVDMHWDLMDLINQKQTRTQDRDRSFSSLPPEEQQKILKWYPDFVKAAAPASTAGVPAEPEQLRGLPRPKDLPLAQGLFQPTKASLDEHFQCPEWFADAKFGFWAHWGPQCVGLGGWYAKTMYDPNSDYPRHVKQFGHPSKVGYKDILPLFTADKFDPEGLMAEFKEMGARMFLAMGTHHDNYDMWNSKYHRWNSVKIGPHKDIVGLWQQAAKKQGLRFGVSEHMVPSYDWWNPNKMSDKTGPLAGVPYDGMDPANWDLYHPPHPGDQNMQAGFGGETLSYPKWYKEHWYRRMYDLVTTYQPDFVDQDDFGLPFWTDSYAAMLVAHYYNRSAASNGGKPDVVWCGRGGNGKKGVITYNEFGLPLLTWRDPWVFGTATSTGWFWTNLQPPAPATLVKTMVEVICRNGNFILSFPQRADGTVPEDHMNCIRELGKWVRLNEEGIFGTRPWRMLGEGPTTTPFNRWDPKEPFFKKEDIRFTRKAGVIYAFLMNPADDKVLIRSLGKKARLADGVPQGVRLLGCEEKLNWSQEEEGLKVQLPNAWVGRTVPVLEIRGFAAWDGDIRPGMDGQLVLDVNDACLHGQKLIQVFGRYFVENWSDPAEWISWDKVNFLEAGEYEVTIYGGGERADVPYRLTIGEKELTGKAPSAGGWGKGVVFPAGKVTIEKAGVYPVALRAGSKENWGGLQVFHLTLKRMK